MLLLTYMYAGTSTIFPHTSEPRVHHPIRTPTTMSNIADRVLLSRRSCKKPPPESAVFSRELHAGKIAEEASEYNAADFNIISAGYPRNEEIQQIQQLYYDSLGTTVEYIRRRDSLISRLLPSLRDDGLVPTYPAKFVEELCVFFHYDEETRNFWNNYCYPLSLYVERATDQTAFIKRKVAERTDILSTAARREHRLGR